MICKITTDQYEQQEMKRREEKRKDNTRPSSFYFRFPVCIAAACVFLRAEEADEEEEMSRR
jgi:hypothetical protein